MVDTTAHEQNPRFEVRVTADSHFAWLRTRLALERTMDAWIRTAVSLIGFGFTIVQFFEKFGTFQGVEPAQPLATRYVGLVLIAAGVLTLVVSGWQYRSVKRYLWEQFQPIAGIDKEPRATATPAITIVMILIGVFAFLVVALRAF